MLHHRSTMKIGTDAVLLSAWVNTVNVNNILDIGTGSGIIALMMAARTNAEVDAVEPDKESADEASENFDNSPFADRLNIYHQDIASFTDETKTKYDLIISNPPFFINDMRPENSRRKQARHSDNLSFSELCVHSKNLLKKDGRLCLVLPYFESKIFLEEAGKQELFLNKRILIFPKPCREPNRVNIELSNIKTETITHEKFIIRDEQGNFTKQYVDLLNKYYISIK